MICFASAITGVSLGSMLTLITLKSLPISSGILLQRIQRAIQDFGAKHRALVVDERENRGLAVHKLAKRNACAVLIAKRNVERNLRIEFLIKADTFQNFGLAAGILREEILLSERARRSGKTQEHGSAEVTGDAAARCDARQTF